jgi:uncharacterized protein
LTPLHCAALSGNIDIADLLIKRKLNINASSIGKMTALGFACQEGYVEMVDFLVQNGAELEIENDNNATSLMIGIFKLYFYLLIK